MLGERVETIDLEELCRRAGITRELAKELEDFGLLAADRERARDKRYAETDADIAAVCAQLTRFGVDARHLRTFRTAADREAALLEQLVAPALRSRNAERRAAGLRDLQSLTELAQELGSLLLWREVREVGSTMSAVDLRTHDPRGGGLPDAGRRVQGHHAAARRPGGAEADDRRAGRLGARRGGPT